MNNIIFIIGLLSIVVWVASLFVRKKNTNAGIIMSWTAILLIVVAIILYYTAR